MERLLISRLRSCRLPRHRFAYQGCAPFQILRHQFHFSARLGVEKPYLLADIGEGITECQIISWSVKPGDKVEQFDPICEVQSDKATVEITSRFDGTVTALHYGEGDVAAVGKPLLSLDISEEDAESDTVVDAPVESKKVKDVSESLAEDGIQASFSNADKGTNPLPVDSQVDGTAPRANLEVLLTPAVRHMLKEAHIDPTGVKGTGKGGRITKDDVQQHIAHVSQSTATPSQGLPESENSTRPGQADQTLRLTTTETAMFKVMTQSLAIPHFLFTHKVDITSVNEFRKKVNSANIIQDVSTALGIPAPKITVLPFIMKALSYTLTRYPKLNSHLHTGAGPADARLVLRGAHNFGVAVDTPTGLLVPVVTDVQNHSAVSLAAEIARLSELGRAGRLPPDSFRHATFSVSNIGAIGGDAVAPIIVAPMVAILGIGAIQEVPVFRKDKQGRDQVHKRQEITLSWSADHRVVDGATVAKAGKLLGELLKDVESLILIGR
ncbi:hypothetical protein LTS03_003360 [Exophiala xenobiotica]|nr:hypothetical protein LTR72_004618 [Exophiala xenobiotica]KAK5293920.1 hypothetical protein LTR14_004811 [Exophiala xenobiotica]KAK5354833.1 hypothetical protein LTR61_002133 [Exophiala xenobiotica]KAK5382823.1 hypothetical protein LTS03_003360 [Exophiala xenobiotica]KAK5496972.1 hypothetical protein LTR55_001462 [Exophiala xenobiotica]